MRLGLFVLLWAVSIRGSEPLQFLSDGHELVRARHYEAGRVKYGQGLTNEAAVARSISQLAIAQSYVLEGDIAKAKAEYARLPKDAPAHHQWEAQGRIARLERRERGLQEWDPEATRMRIVAAPKSAVTLHVAATGSDTNTGAADQPFATLARAREKIRLLPKTNGSIEVIIHGGEYQVTETLRLDARDSGNADAPVIYRAAAGERPVFRGGVRLRGFQVVKEGGNFERLPQEARGKVVEVDLRENGITAVFPLKLGGFASGHGFKTHPAHELFFNGQALQLARGPNDGFVRIKDVLVKDGTKGYDRQGSRVGKFTFSSDAPLRWKNEPDLLLYGYWFWDWADSYERVASIDPEARAITLAEPFHTYGYSINAPFYAINALCELDRPGEWYLDRENLSVLFWPPGELAGASVELSILNQRMLELGDVSHVRFEGIVWELGSADAIRVSGGSDVLFAGCAVRRFAGDGIEISGGQRHGILSCDVYSMGRGGTLVSGGDRKTLSPGGHFVENCDIHTLSRIDHTYTPAVVLNGVGNRVAHNRFHKTASSALRVEGNDHLIEFNEVFDVVQESDDQGGADMYGNPTYRGNIFRFNRWRHIGNWQGEGEAPKCGQAGIRLDDAICGTLVYGNIFERCAAGKIGFGAVQIHGGKENIIDNNLFIACSAAVSFTPWPPERWKSFVGGALEAKQIDQALYLRAYPDLAKLTDEANVNQVWRSRTVIAGEMFRRAPKEMRALDNDALDCCDPFDEMPGFNPIPHQMIGLYEDEFRRGLRR